MNVGVFHPVIDCCGGAEWVAINIINTLSAQGHKITILTDKFLNQAKIANVFNRTVSVDKQIIFPFTIFPPTDYHNVYTNMIRSSILKAKCDILVDTFSNSVLPGMDVSYIHYPLLKRVETELSYLRNKIYFYPYKTFLSFFQKKIDEKLFFANSGFTSNAIKTEFSTNSHILYPPVPNEIFLNQNATELDDQRENTVITIARISHEKNLQTIPHIAKFTHKDTTFVIAGLLDSPAMLESLQKTIKKLEVSRKVKILANVERNRLNALLLKSKIYLHPTINEHFGVSIVEAMSSGCVPIVHNSGGPKEFVPRHLRYESIEEAAQKIDKAIESWSPKEPYRISKHAQRFSERNFSDRFMKIFNSYFK